MTDAERLVAMLQTAAEALPAACYPIHDWHGPRGEAHLLGRGFVLIDRFTDRAGILGGDRLVVLRDGRLAVQQRTGTHASGWSAGWTAAGPSADIRRDGATYHCEPLRAQAPSLLGVYRLRDIGAGCLRLMAARQRQLLRAGDALEIRRRAVLGLVASADLALAPTA
jgi:hypothetical protein